jgi:hypothetical protein
MNYRKEEPFQLESTILQAALAEERVWLEGATQNPFRPPLAGDVFRTAGQHGISKVFNLAIFKLRRSYSNAGMAFLGVLFLMATQAHAQETRNDLWPGIDVYIKLNQKSRLVIQYSGNRQDYGEIFADGSLGGNLDIYLLPVLRRKLRQNPDASHNKLLTVRMGYVFTTPPPSSSAGYQEHKVLFEGTGRAPLPGGLLFSDRNRFDLRFLDGAFTPRYRNRLKLERASRIGHLECIPYGSAEAFYDWRYGQFNRFQYALGVETTLNRHFVLEGYYGRQVDHKSSPEYLNVLGITLQFYFR